MPYLHRNIKIRLLVLICQRLGTTLIIPFMAIYFARNYGTSIAGVIVFLSVMGNILAGFYSGFYSDKHGRKNILVYSSIVRFGAVLLMALSNIPGQSIPSMTIFSFILINVCSGLSGPSNQAMIIDITTQETRKYVYTLFYWINNTALAIGTLLGAFLFESHLFELILVVAFLNLLTFLMVKYMLVETHTLIKVKLSTQSPFIEFLSSYKMIIKDRIFSKFIIAALLALGLELQLGNYISVYLERNFQTFKLSEIKISGIEMYGILQVENAVIVIILTGILAKLLTKWRISNIKQLLFGLALYTVGFSSLLLSLNFYFLIFVMIILSIGEIIYVPVQNTLLAELPDDNNRSKYMAMNTLNTSGAVLLGALGLIIGGVISPLAISFIYLTAGVVSMILFFDIFKNLKGRAQF